jgi:hypothetical protein
MTSAQEPSRYWSNPLVFRRTPGRSIGPALGNLIDAKRRDLAWRLFIQQQILNVDKLPEKIDKEIAKGFESFPPTEKDKQEVRNEHAKQAAKNQKSQVQ